MDRVVVVGSGASGVHFALSALQKGYRVLMLDVGNTPPAAASPDVTLNGLKQNLPDPARYFLGPGFESLILPGNGTEYYGFPPNKAHVFQPHREFRYQAQGFSPLLSFARGGLSEAWTGGCYPFNDEDLGRFPFEYDELGPSYTEVARRIGLSGEIDDLAAFFPVHGHMMEPLRLDEHSALLLDTYRARKRYLNESLSCFMGRARLATLSSDYGGRKGCSYSGRCLWGCPSRSLYTPSITLEECRQYPNFEYAGGLFADHFRFDGAGRIRAMLALDSGGRTQEFEGSKFVLAAGTISSARIFLESLYRDSGAAVQLRGLMDNRQVLMPFVNLRMIGKRFNPDSYQYHQLAIGVRESPLDYVHGLVTTLKTAMIHPVVQKLPFDLGTSLSVFRNLHAGLGLVNINFADTRRDDNYVALEPAGKERRIEIHYQPEAGEAGRISRMTGRFRKILRKLGCVAPSAMTRLRPMGASVHYAGTLPMSDTPAPLTCSKDCRSHDFENLYFVDGTAFPVLPAKNLTFTLMANAVRVAERAF